VTVGRRVRETISGHQWLSLRPRTAYILSTPSARVGERLPVVRKHRVAIAQVLGLETRPVMPPAAVGDGAHTTWASVERPAATA